MIYQKLEKNGFDFGRASAEIRKALDKLKHFPEEENEKLKVLDRKIFDALKEDFRDDPVIIKTEQELIKEEIYNEGFNSTLEDKSTYEQSMPDKRDHYQKPIEEYESVIPKPKRGGKYSQGEWIEIRSLFDNLMKSPPVLEKLKEVRQWKIQLVKEIGEDYFKELFLNGSKHQSIEEAERNPSLLKGFYPTKVLEQYVESFTKLKDNSVLCQYGKCIFHDPENRTYENVLESYQMVMKNSFELFDEYMKVVSNADFFDGSISLKQWSDKYKDSSAYSFLKAFVLTKVYKLEIDKDEDYNSALANYFKNTGNDQKEEEKVSREIMEEVVWNFKPDEYKSIIKEERYVLAEGTQLSPLRLLSEGELTRSYQLAKHWTNDFISHVNFQYTHFKDRCYYDQGKPLFEKLKKLLLEAKQYHPAEEKLAFDPAVIPPSEELAIQSTPETTPKGTLRPKFMESSMLLGKEIEILLPNGEKRRGQFAVAELGTIIASHNEDTFSSSAGYPVDEEGNNVNDRNYQDDPNAQAKVLEVAQNLEPSILVTTSRTPAGTPIISTDGFVVSGNNRTMSLKLALKNYSEKYEEYKKLLIAEAEAFGISKTTMSAIVMGDRVADERKPGKLFNERTYEDYVKIEHPVLVRFDYDFPEYTTLEISKYNKDTKKSERPIDKAIKLSHILNENERLRDAISHIVGEYETLSDFYSSLKDQKRLIEILTEGNILTEQEIASYYMETGFNASGKDLIEMILASIVLKKEALTASEMIGVKRFRNIVITSLPVLVKNASLAEGNLADLLNEAIVLELEIYSSGLSFKDYISQSNLFKELPERNVFILNRMLDSGRNNFKKSMEAYNASILDNQGENLFGTKPSLEEIFNVHIAAKIDEKEKQLIEKYSKGSDKSYRIIENLYHGTCQKYKRFDKAYLGANTGDLISYLGFHFTPNIKVSQLLFANEKDKKDCKVFKVSIQVRKTLKIKESDLAVDMVKYGYEKGFLSNHKITISDQKFKEFLNLPYSNYAPESQFFELKRWKEQFDFENIAQEYLNEKLLSKGYDSIEYLNEIELLEEKRYDWIIFNEKAVRVKEVIKSSLETKKEEIELYDYVEFQTGATGEIKERGYVAEVLPELKVRINNVLFTTDKPFDKVTLLEKHSTYKGKYGYDFNDIDRLNKKGYFNEGLVEAEDVKQYIAHQDKSHAGKRAMFAMGEALLKEFEANYNGRWSEDQNYFLIDVPLSEEVLEEMKLICRLKEQGYEDCIMMKALMYDGDYLNDNKGHQPFFEDYTSELFLKEVAKFKTLSEFKKKYQELNQWIDIKDTAKLGVIRIQDTNWYPTKTSVEYSKNPDEFPFFQKLINHVKSGKGIPPVIAERSVFNDGRNGYTVRDGVHRLSAYEHEGIEFIPALVYDTTVNTLTRDFDNPYNISIRDFLGIKLDELYYKAQLLNDSKKDNDIAQPGSYRAYDHVVDNVILPAKVRESFVSDFISEVFRRELIKDKKFKDLRDLKEADLPTVSSGVMYELMQLSHPEDYKIGISRMALIEEWNQRGEQIFKGLGFPTDYDYPYVNKHTGYLSVDRLEDALGGEYDYHNWWWSVAEHSFPVADMQKALEIIEKEKRKWEELREPLFNPKTGKAKGKSKSQVNTIEYKIKSLEESKEVIEKYLKKHMVKKEQDKEDLNLKEKKANAQKQRLRLLNKKLQLKQK